MIETFPWTQYSKKLKRKILEPRNGGFLTQKVAEERALHLAVGRGGDIEKGNIVYLYILVDPDDGIIVDAKFQAFGETALIGASEITCDLLAGKSYDQARRLTLMLIDRKAQDNAATPAFPQSTHPHIELVLTAIADAVNKCLDIPIIDSSAPPTPFELSSDVEVYPNWKKLSDQEKIQVIEEVIQKDIRPYIELDEGGVEIKELRAGHELIIAYQGACTSCYSATGSTLSAIENILKTKVHPGLRVTPDLSNFQAPYSNPLFD